MKRTMKITCIVLITLVMMLVAISPVFAIQPNEMTGDDNVSSSDLVTMGNRLVTILTTVGVVLSVIMLIVLGIKYMMGSAEEKAEYKKTMMPYLIGAALIFCASLIAQAVYSFLT